MTLSVRNHPKDAVSKPSDFVEFSRQSVQQCIHQRFEEQVRCHAGRIALKTRRQACTYAGVNEDANAIADELLKVGGTTLAQVAVLLPHSVEMIASLLGAFKSHKVFVPLDPCYPKERLRLMLEDADAIAILTDDQNMRLAEDLSRGRIHILNIANMQQSEGAPNPNVACEPMDRAYILYTSGSTGRPKGIEFLHRNLLHHIMCMTNNLYFAPSDRLTWLHSASFAASVVDIYSALLNGATLYPWEVKSQGFTHMADWFNKERITSFQWIPSAFRQFLRTVPGGFVFDTIRLVVMASEPLTAREVKLFQRHFCPESRLINQLGTSESYNYRLFSVDQRVEWNEANVPGGYSVSGERQVVILDEDHHAVREGEIGEIGIKSDFMSVGYWRNPALTCSKFIRGNNGQPPIYLTGDLGRIEPDGCLLHLGRKDFQIKLRGFRIEVAEIELGLTKVTGIVDSVVGVAQNEFGEDKLVAYVQLGENVDPDFDHVKERLGLTMPDYMIPDRFVVVQDFPTLDTGKIDRSSLPNPYPQGQSYEVAQKHHPHNVEQEIVSLFQGLLPGEAIGSESDFFELGGNSLLTAVLLCRLHQSFGTEMTIEDLIQSPNPVALAGIVEGRK